jgi:hypothetical protein
MECWRAYGRRECASTMAIDGSASGCGPGVTVQLHQRPGQDSLWL